MEEQFIPYWQELLLYRRDYLVDEAQNKEHFGASARQNAGIAFLYFQPGRFADRSPFPRNGNGNASPAARIAYILSERLLAPAPDIRRYSQNRHKALFYV